MPYIDPDRRFDFAKFIRDGNVERLGEHAQNAGELNYLISKIFVGYVKRHRLSYSIINDILGALRGAELEFYRRIAAPYEDQAMVRNGDVYQQILP